MSPNPIRPHHLPGPPADLIPGAQYLLVNHAQPEPVTFIGFSPYPATVIVLDRRSRRFYCARQHLRSLPGQATPES